MRNTDDSVRYIWLALAILWMLDFITTVAAPAAWEFNLMLRPLLEQGNYLFVALNMLINTPFFVYGIWTFFGRKKWYLYMNLVFYGIITASNLVVMLA